MIAATEENAAASGTTELCILLFMSQLYAVSKLGSSISILRYEEGFLGIGFDAIMTE